MTLNLHLPLKKLTVSHIVLVLVLYIFISWPQLVASAICSCIL